MSFRKRAAGGHAGKPGGMSFPLSMIRSGESQWLLWWTGGLVIGLLRLRLRPIFERIRPFSRDSLGLTGEASHKSLQRLGSDQTRLTATSGGDPQEGHVQRSGIGSPGTRQAENPCHLLTHSLRRNDVHQHREATIIALGRSSRSSFGGSCSGCGEPKFRIRRAT
jgi:hypothetical protein